MATRQAATRTSLRTLVRHAVDPVASLGQVPTRAEASRNDVGIGTCRRLPSLTHERRARTGPSSADWVGDLGGRLGVDQAACRGRGAATVDGRDGSSEAHCTGMAGGSLELIDHSADADIGRMTMIVPVGMRRIDQSDLQRRTAEPQLRRGSIRCRWGPGAHGWWPSTTVSY